MMFVTRRAIPRRTMLRGLGVTLALPLLDGMVPAFAAMRAAPAMPARRLGIVYVPNGMIMNAWTPAAEGASFDLTPTLEPLKAFRDQLIVLSGLANKEAHPREGEGSGPHARACGAFLTGAHVFKTEGADVQSGTSLDQLVARELASETQLASLEMGLETSELVGACDAGYSCAYEGTISWRTPTLPLPMEHDPRAIFERLFGDSGSSDPRARLARTRPVAACSIRSARNWQASARRWGRAIDRSCPSTSTRFATSSAGFRKRRSKAIAILPVVEQPAGIPDSYEDFAKLMFDLQVLAYQCDLTRVITFMFGHEHSARTYPQVGVSDPHHPTSHHQNNPEKMAKVARINRYHMSLFAYYLEKLRATPDGDGSLLDHMILLYGAGISDPDLHDPENLPILMLGGGAGQIKSGRHLRYRPGQPISNLYLSVLDKMNVPVERFGDSTGRLTLLSDL
jgi:hypothetical protein